MTRPTRASVSFEDLAPWHLSPLVLTVRAPERPAGLAHLGPGWEEAADAERSWDANHLAAQALAQELDSLPGLATECYGARIAIGIGEAQLDPEARIRAAINIERLLGERVGGRLDHVVDWGTSVLRRQSDLRADERWRRLQLAWALFAEPYLAGRRILRTDPELWGFTHLGAGHLTHALIRAALATRGAEAPRRAQITVSDARLAAALAAAGVLETHGWVEPGSLAAKANTRPNEQLVSFTPAGALAEGWDGDLFADFYDHR
jgi:hypothetical protein